MSQILNAGGNVTSDTLIYDGSHELDARNVALTVNSGDTKAGGTVEKGQVIDFDSTAGTYSVHATGGTPAAVLAEEASYAEDDTSLTVTVYTTGTFRESEVVADPELTAADIDALQKNGIFLK